MMKEIFSHLYPGIIFLFLLVGCGPKTIEKLHSIDGPYIYEEQNGFTLISVEKTSDSSYYIHNKKIKKIDNKDEDSFSFSLMDTLRIPPSVYPEQNKILVTSDNEGNFNSFYSLLVSSKVMDINYNWTFEDGHLIIAGDMFDRGDNVIPCLWMVYNLEQQAKKAGGGVHFILGNHEVMNLQGNIKYVRPKYIDLAKILFQESDEKKAYLQMMSNTNILVQWIKSKNTIEKIGNKLFLHGGISEEILDANLSIQEMNTIVRNNIHTNLSKEPSENQMTQLVMGRFGPLWYRGMVKSYKEYYKKLDPSSIDAILDFYEVDHIIIGHTVVADEITADFDGKVIRVDIKHSSEKFSGKSQALLIEGDDTFFKLNDMGEKFELKFKELSD